MVAAGRGGGVRFRNIEGLFQKVHQLTDEDDFPDAPQPRDGFDYRLAEERPDSLSVFLTVDHDSPQISIIIE